MPGVEDVWINEQGTENEMTSTSPEQNRALVLKAFELQQAAMTPAERFWSQNLSSTAEHIPPGYTSYETLRQEHRRDAVR
jgi:hypothetical protein